MENPEIPAVAEPVEEEASLITKLYAFGSAECDQYKVSDDEDENESKRPVELTGIKRNLRVKGQILSLVCGGLHTVFLTSRGEVYTFGCNDDGALGRVVVGEGAEKLPGKVELDFPANMIAAGDSHSVACNSKQNKIFHWGVYRNVHKGNISKSEKPHRIGENEIKGTITKILSGAHHTMVVADGKIYAWGDSDAGILGRVPTDRRKLDQGLKIEGMGVKGVQDIFTGAYHSFLKKEVKGKDGNYSAIFAWGNNNCGQLGIGTNHMFSAIPVEIVEFRGKNIIQITGGEHHTIALSEAGQVYAFGKNDDGQLGLGEDYEQPSSEKSSPSKGEESKEENMDLEKKDEAPVKKVVDKTETKFVSRPTQVKKNIEDVKITSILSGSSFNYAIAEDEKHEKKIFSWGVGDNYVLGSREEETRYDPEPIPFTFFKVKNLHQIALSAQHVVFVGSDEDVELKFDPEVFTEAAEKKEKPEPKKKGGKAANAKKDQEADKKDDSEDKPGLDEEKVTEEEIKKPVKKGGKKKAAEKEDKADEEAGKASSSKDEKAEEKSDDEKEEEKAEPKATKKPAPRGRSTKKKEEKEEKEEEKAEPKDNKKSRKATSEKKKEEKVTKEAPTSTRPTRSSARNEKSTDKKEETKKADTKKGKSKSKSPEKKKDDKKDNKANKKVHEAKKRKASDDNKGTANLKKVKKTTKK